MSKRMATVGIIFLTLFLGHSFPHSYVPILAQDRIFPTVVIPIPVQPQPEPPIPILAQDRIYIAKSNEHFILISSPRNAAAIQVVRGPISVYGKFADTPEKLNPELRTFTEQHVCIVTPLTNTGTVELIAIPESAKSADQLQRITLQLGPIPPPVPPTPVPPGPTPTPTPTPVTELRIVFLYDMSKGYIAPVQQILDSRLIREYMTEKVTKTDNTPDWRYWDIDAPLADNASKPLADLWNEIQAKKPTGPTIVIRKNGVTSFIPLPDTESKTLELLKTYGG